MQHSPGPLIRVEGLRKTFRVAERDPGVWGAVKGLAIRRYREVEALKGISFELNPGELVGYIGPNGAGKSTTIKILSGIIQPTAGKCDIGGFTPWTDRIQHVARIGVVFGQRTQLWWDLPVRESFDLLRDIYRVPEAQYRETADLMIGLMGIEPILNTPVRQLSLGQRMRCDIAAAMLHQPTILFLDEPTIGLDAISKLAVREFIKGLNRDHGVTVILTTHDMHDIQALADRVIVIGNGEILQDGTFESLRAEISDERRLIIDLAEEVDEAIDIDIDGVTSVINEAGQIEIAFDPNKIRTADLIQKVTSEHSVRDLFIDEPPIEEIIARLYKRHGAGEG